MSVMSLLFPRFVDSAVPLTKAQRKIARARAWSKWRLNRWNLAIYFATFGCLFAVLFLAMLSINQVINSMMPGLVGILFFIATWVVASLSYRLLQLFRYAPHYRRAVRELGIDVCVGCGYWLHGLDDQIKECPECGLSRSSIAMSGRDPIPWDAEACHTLAEFGYQPCGECGAVYKSQMKHCPECGAKREPMPAKRPQMDTDEQGS
jgi:RNA polymerase subunit RPABC4/transcription elongation factor Spt4